MTGTDWLATLREQADIGKQMAQDVPLMLARPDVTLVQVRRVFGALDHQAHFAEELAKVLEEKGYDFAVVDAARALEDLFAELAAAAADKMVQMRR
jgi:cellulose biosynthesis protein BcsQ